MSSTTTSTVRVYELARETGLDNKEVLRRLEDLDIEASTHSSSISVGEAQRFRESLGKSDEQRRREEEERRRKEQEELEHYRRMAEEVTTEGDRSGQKAKKVLPPHLREQAEDEEEPSGDGQQGASIGPGEPGTAGDEQEATAAGGEQAEATTAEPAEAAAAADVGARADTDTGAEATAPTAGAEDATTETSGASGPGGTGGGGGRRMPGAPPPEHSKGDVPLRPQLRKQKQQDEQEPPPTVTGEGPTRGRRHTTNLPKEGSGKRTIPKPVRKAPPRPERPSRSGDQEKQKQDDSPYRQPVGKEGGGDGARPGENKPASGEAHRREKTTPEERELQRRPQRRDVPLEQQIRADRVELLSGVTVGELADELGVPGAALVKRLFDMGEMATVQQTLPDDTVEILAADLGFEAYFMSQAEAEFGVEEPDDEEELVLRAPVVTVMGHVDHGKTQLLDAIRQTDVVATEAGGITQHIGAYQVTHDDAPITFIDTPGHEAFTAMRARGADVTDVVILVVAADDGVMPQTVEAINHARAAGVPIVVAINKMDLEAADPDKIKGQLTEHELVAEEYGGETMVAAVSALEREGIDDLLEMVSLQAELLELQANPDKDARGRVVEAHLDTGRGPTATLLVQDGSLHRGDVLVAGATDGKVRAMFDENGDQLDEAGPSKPVQVLGLDDVPEAGDQFRVVDEERFARDVAERRSERERRKELAQQRRPATLEELTEEVREGEKEELNVIIKADVSGSAEALQDALDAMEFEEVRISVVHTGVGAVTESDVRLAETSDAILIGFNVRPGAKARDEIERAGVELRTYSIIYEALEDIQRAVAGLLGPEHEERTIGRVEVRELFKVPDIGFVFGCYVTDGVVRRDAQVRVVRDGAVVAEDRVDSLKRFDDDVREVSEGYECGIGLRSFQDVKVEDEFEVFETVEVERDVTPV